MQPHFTDEETEDRDLRAGVAAARFDAARPGRHSLPSRSPGPPLTASFPAAS